MIECQSKKCHEEITDEQALASLHRHGLALCEACDEKEAVLAEADREADRRDGK